MKYFVTVYYRSLAGNALEKTFTFTGLASEVLDKARARVSKYKNFHSIDRVTAKLLN